MKEHIIAIALASAIILVMATDAKAGPYVEIGAGFNVDDVFGCTICWDDANAGPLGAYIRVGHELPYGFGIHWVHLSQWSEGFPVNGKDESSVDHLGVYYRYEF